MQHTPYQHLAKEFIDLWQKQFATVMNDKQFIHAMLDMFKSTSNAASHDHPRNAPPTQSAPTADANHGLLAELAFRLAMCEKRLAQLEQRESKPQPKSKRTTKRASGSRSTRSTKPRQ